MPFKSDEVEPFDGPFKRRTAQGSTLSVRLPFEPLEGGQETEGSKTVIGTVLRVTIGSPRTLGDCFTSARHPAPLHLARMGRANLLVDSNQWLLS